MQILMNKFNGTYGFIIRPDLATQKKAINLAKKYFVSFDYLVKEPHVTLYHAFFNDLPEKIVKDILVLLRKNLYSKFLLSKINIFGGRFVFWNLKNNETVHSMHRVSLMASKFLDKKVVAMSIKENLELDSEEKMNIKKYGHPLVLKKYTPHITLAYNNQAIKKIDVQVFDHEFITQSILFSKIGKYGSVQSVVDL